MWSWVPSARAPRSNDIVSPSVGGTDAQVVQHDAGPTERDVPVVGLMQVVVQPDDRAGLAIGAVALDHLARLRDPFAAERLDEDAALVAVDVGLDDVDAGDLVALADRRPRVTPGRLGSGRPSIRRVACGRSPDRGRLRPLGRAASRWMRCTPTMRLRSSTTECSISASTSSQPGADRRVRADVGVDELRAGADDRRAAHDRVRSARRPPRRPRGPRRASGRRRGRRPAARSCRARGSCTASSGSFLPVSIHQPVEHLVADTVALVEQPLDRVGDLELAAARRLDGAHRVVDRRVEQVDADEREVRRRIGRLLDELHDVAVRVERGDTELRRVVDVREEDLRDGRRRSSLAQHLLRVSRRRRTRRRTRAGSAGACCRRGT